MALESLADRVKAQGKDDTAMRATIKNAAKLTDQEADLLKQVARHCNTDYDTETARGTSTVKDLRKQYQSGSVSPAALSQQSARLRLNAPR
jgi:hypothetical protein